MSKSDCYRKSLPPPLKEAIGCTTTVNEQALAGAIYKNKKERTDLACFGMRVKKCPLQEIEPLQLLTAGIKSRRHEFLANSRYG